MIHKLKRKFWEYVFYLIVILCADLLIRFFVQNPEEFFSFVIIFIAVVWGVHQVVSEEVSK